MSRSRSAWSTVPPSAPPRTSLPLNAPTNASWSAPTIAGRAMMRTSQPGSNEGAITLSASRIRRRTRFRTTAPPRRRPVDSPKRVVSRSVRRNRAESRAWDLVDPALLDRREVLRSGEHHESRRGVPRPSVRPSAASDPEPAVQQGHAGPRRLHAGAEAVLLGAMAFLGLVGLLHPDGPVDPLDPTPGTVAPSSPRGTQTRRCPTGHMARRRPADDRTPTGPASVKRRSRALTRGRRSRSRRTVEDGLDDPSHGYSQGVCRNRLATAIGAVLSSPGPRRRRRSRETPAGLWRRRRQRSSGLVGRMSSGRPIASAPRPDPGRRYLSTSQPIRRSHRTNGREAGLAGRPG